MPSDPKSAAHADIVFEAAADRPRPRLPRTADGIKYLTLDQAAEKYNLPRQSLLGEWLSTFSSLDLDPPALSTAAPVPADGRPAGVTPASPEDATPGEAPSIPAAAAAAGTGGAGALLPMTVAPIVRELLRSQCFPRLSDEDLDQVIAFASLRGFDPFIELWAERQWDAEAGTNGENRLIIGPTIAGLRARAERSGQFVGCDDIAFEYASEDDCLAGRPPIAASTAVYKLVSGIKARYPARVRWNEIYGSRDAGWQAEKPEMALGKCARAAAIREGFSVETGKLYIREEMTGRFPPSPAGSSRNGRRNQAPSDTGPDVHIPMDPPPSPPATASSLENVCDRRSFDMALVDLYELKEPDRRRVLSLAHEKFRNYQIPEDEFFRRAIKDVWANPRSYGLSRPAA